MRVIAGSARSLRLKTVSGTETRPTTDQIKETLFNILNPYLDDCTFLDLFSGSGGIGIEALSRGAKHAVFVDKNPKAIACVKENLSHTHLEKQASVITKDVRDALQELDGKEQFDFIFMDPPYHLGCERSVFSDLATSTLFSERGILIAEAAMETSFSFAEAEGFHLLRTKEYRTNKHLFFAPPGRKS